MNAKTTLETVSCARFPAQGLAALAGLRRVEGISVLADGEHTWVFWEAGTQEVARALLPVEGIELFERRGELWHRWGHRLPSFEVPSPDEAIGIDRAIFPATFEAITPEESCPRPSNLRLVRDGRQRPSTAAFCPVEELGRWANSAPSHAIESVRGAIQEDHALILGRGLPLWPGSTRYWGDRVLVPIGFQVHPSFAEDALLEALGGSGREVFRFLVDDSARESVVVEAIPFDAFRPLSRAGIRLALGAKSS